MWFLVASTYCSRTDLTDIMFEARLMAADHQDQGLLTKVTHLRPVLLAGKLYQF